MKIYTKDGEKELEDLTDGERRKFETESTINWNELESVIYIISSSEREWKRIEKFGIKPYRETTDRNTGLVNTKWFMVPKEWLRIRPPVVMKLSEEQKKDRATRARATIAKGKDSKRRYKA